MTRSSPSAATFAKHWSGTSFTNASSTSRHLVKVFSRPGQQYIARLPFKRGRLCRVHSLRREESFFADLSAGEPPAGSNSLVKSRRPSLRHGVCPSQVSQQVWCLLPTSHMGPSHFASALCLVLVLQAQHRCAAELARCKSAVRYGWQPAFRTTRATYLCLLGPQAVRRQILAGNSRVGSLVRSVREVLKRPDGQWFRNPSLGKVLVICEVSVTVHVRRAPNCPPLGTDLAGLRDELACVTSACRRHEGSDVVASQISLRTRRFGRHPAASSSPHLVLSQDAVA